MSEVSWDLTLAQHLVDACLGWDANKSTTWNTLPTVLNRATKPEHGVKARLADSLLAYIALNYAIDLAPVLVEAAMALPEGRLPEAIMTIVPRMQIDELEAFDHAVPYATTRLAELALSVRERLHASKVQQLTQISDHQAMIDFADISMSMSKRLLAVGQRKDAIEHARKAAEFARPSISASNRPDQTRLARSLSHLAISHIMLGQLDRARDPAFEAIGIYRDIDDGKSPDIARERAKCLISFGICASKSGCFTINDDRRSRNPRSMMTDEPDIRLLIDLAGAEVNRASYLLQLEQIADAKKASRVSIELFGVLASHRPDEFGVDLAKAHGCLARCCAAADDASTAAMHYVAGLKSLISHVHFLPEAHGDLARHLWFEYSNTCEKLGVELDLAILGQLAERLAHGTTIGEGNTGKENLLMRVFFMLEAQTRMGAAGEDPFETAAGKEYEKIIFREQDSKMFDDYFNDYIKEAISRDLAQQLGEQFKGDLQFDKMDSSIADTPTHEAILDELYAKAAVEGSLDEGLLRLLPYEIATRQGACGPKNM